MIDAILDEATKILDIPGRYGALQDFAWIVALDESRAVLVRHVESSGRVSFEYEIGTLPAANRERLLTLMLQFNYLSPDCMGLRTAVTQDGSAHLIIDKEDDRIESNAVANLIALLAEKGRHWERLVEAVATGASTEAALRSEGWPPLDQLV